MSEKKPAARREVKVAVGYPPVASLLPPEVGERKAAARARGRAILAALIALAIAVLAATGANIYAIQRTHSLESARAWTLSLVEQQGQYNEVRLANQQLNSAKAARIFATSTEISVNEMIIKFEGLFSPGMAMASYSLETATPLLTFPPSLSPIEPESMAKFTMEVSAPAAAAIDTWVRELPKIKGIADASISRLMADEGSEGYSATVTIFVANDALTHRFDGVETQPTVEEESAPTPAATPEPTPTPAPSEEMNTEEDGS